MVGSVAAGSGFAAFPRPEENHGHEALRNVLAESLRDLLAELLPEVLAKALRNVPAELLRLRAPPLPSTRGEHALPGGCRLVLLCFGRCC